MQRCWRSSVWIHTVLLVEVQRVFVCCRRLSTFRGVESHHRQHRQHTESKEHREFDLTVHLIADTRLKRLCEEITTPPDGLLASSEHAQ
ncbi:hypothetical protein F2P81_012947 [Scophthalmus maximus]|uniref:Secreted protein n=1 Tax=Scophthalmus maximus TaxID=52904 RepID=A0A6A4SR84_SCOMX|nr:hypothetical protein F2P81_012947 [Scophthalmus maximus]